MKSPPVWGCFGYKEIEKMGLFRFWDEEKTMIREVSLFRRGKKQIRIPATPMEKSSERDQTRATM